MIVRSLKPSAARLGAVAARAVVKEQAVPQVFRRLQVLRPKLPFPVAEPHSALLIPPPTATLQVRVIRVQGSQASTAPVQHAPSCLAQGRNGPPPWLRQGSEFRLRLSIRFRRQSSRATPP